MNNRDIIHEENFNIQPTNYSRFQIDKYSSWYVFSSTGFTEECIKAVITTSDSFV